MMNYIVGENISSAYVSMMLKDININNEIKPNVKSNLDNISEVSKL